MEQQRVGDRVKVGDRICTIGLTARRAGSRRSARVAVTVADLRALAQRLPAEAVVSSSELLASVPIHTEPGQPKHGRTIGELCELDEQLGEEAVRYGAGPYHGVVAALRGAVRLRLPEAVLTVHGLIEIKFDTQIVDSETGAQVPVPELEPEDAGSLVTLWNGDVIGLLVGRTGTAAFVAPVQPFLEAHGLEHDRFISTAAYQADEHGRLAVEQHAGLEALTAQLAREESLGLADIPEAA